MRKCITLLGICMTLLFCSLHNASAQTVTAGATNCTQITQEGAGTGGPYGASLAYNTCRYQVTVFYCQASQSPSCAPNGQPNLGDAWSSQNIVGGGTFSVSKTGASSIISFLECPMGSGPAPTGTAQCQSNASRLSAAILPNAVAARVGDTATAFFTIQNSNTSYPSQTKCQIALESGAPSGLSLTYQETNPATNQPIGTPNTPVTIASGAAQSFVVSFSSTASFSVQNLPLLYDCAQDFPVVPVNNVNTMDLTFSTGYIAEIVALATTPTNNGILSINIAQNPANAFAVATSNSGIADTITAKVSTGGITLPLTVTMCQTNPSTGQCYATPASSVTLPIAADATPTFSIFATAQEKIPLAPNTNRILVQFFNSSGSIVGATSVAITAS